MLAVSLLLNQKVKTDDDDYTEFLKRGRYHMDRSEYQEAIKYFERAIEIKGDMVEAYKDLGWAYLSIQGFHEAVRVYRKLLDIEPENRIAHNNIGFAFRMADEPDSAIVAYEFALEWIPDDLFILHRLGELYYSLGRYRPAADISARCIDVESRFIQCREILANSYFALGEYYLQEGYRDSVDVVYELLLKLDARKAEELTKLKNRQ